MDISELRVIYSPHYEGTTVIRNLIKQQFRQNRMVCRVWVQECMPLNSHWLGMEALISMIIGLLHSITGSTVQLDFKLHEHTRVQ